MSTMRTATATENSATSGATMAPEPTTEPPDSGFASRLLWSARDCWTIVMQEFTHLLRQPSTIAWQLGFPVVMVLMFVFVFGSAMDVTGQGAGEGYVDFAMPGMFAMTMAFGFMDTAYAVTHNKEKGFMDRFRSMPMASSAPVTGRALSDVLRAALDLAVIVGVALLIGWRSGGSPAATLLAFALLLWLRLALIFIGIFLGLCINNTETAGGLFAVAFPLGFISSVFTPPEMMPGWLGAIAAWNPVSSTATAIRELFRTPGIESLEPSYWIDGHAVTAAVIWPVALMLVFVPLAVRQFKNLRR